MLADKLGFDRARVRDARRLLHRIASAQPSRPDEVVPVTGDASDDVILACAIEAGADVLVTGDKRHLFPVGEYRGVRMLTSPALLAELRTHG